MDRFNSTVTNGELRDDVGELRDDVAELRKDVSAALARQEQQVLSSLEATRLDVSKSVDAMESQVDATLHKAQQSIDKDIDSISGTLSDYQESTSQQFLLENSFMLYQLAGTFTLIGMLISVYHVSSHLRHFYNPVVQRKVLAILWMAPVYQTTSWFALVFPKSSPYLSIIKDCYESYVVYTFLSFLIAVMGGGDHNLVIRKLAERMDKEQKDHGQQPQQPQQSHQSHQSHITIPVTVCGCFYKQARKTTVGTATVFLYQCLFFCLQFTLLKPILAVASFLVNDLQYWGPTESVESESESPYTPYTNPSVYILILQNLSVSMAFYGLLKFFHAVSYDLEWVNPWPKFLCIKGVVFVTFWQGMVITALARSNGAGGIAGGGGMGSNVSSSSSSHDEQWAKQAQSFLICIEMLLASIAHFYVFPVEEWNPDYKRDRVNTIMRFGDNIALRDFFSDIRTVMGGSHAKSGNVGDGSGVAGIGGGDGGNTDVNCDGRDGRDEMAGQVEVGGGGTGEGADDVMKVEAMEAMERIRVSLAGIEEGKGLRSDARSGIMVTRTELANNNVTGSVANLGMIDETSSLLRAVVDDEEKEEGRDVEEGGGRGVGGEGDEDEQKVAGTDDAKKVSPHKKTTKHFRPRNSRLHR
jgi:hypothetical protein